MLIVIDGSDGVGKTTQCGLLRDRLIKKGVEALVLKTLDSTVIGNLLGNLLRAGVISEPEEQLFAFLLATARLYRECVIPALTKGVTVILDRGVGSHLSYFGALGFGREQLDEMLWFIPKDLPTLTILLDMDTARALKRKSAPSMFDRMSEEFFGKQRKIFLALAREKGWTVLNADRSIQDIHQEVLATLKRETV